MKTKDLPHNVIFTMPIWYLGILGRHQIWMLCRNGVTGWLLSTCKEHKPRKGQGGSGQIKEKVSNLSGLTQYFTRHSLTPYHLHSKTRQRLTGNKIASTGNLLKDVKLWRWQRWDGRSPQPCSQIAGIILFGWHRHRCLDQSFFIRPIILWCSRCMKFPGSCTSGSKNNWKSLHKIGRGR